MYFKMFRIMSVHFIKPVPIIRKHKIVNIVSFISLLAEFSGNKHSSSEKIKKYH